MQQNVLINSLGKAILTDFGLSRFSPNDANTTRSILTSGDLKGTTCYLAIEIVAVMFSPVEVGNGSEGDEGSEDILATMKCHTMPSDVWAFGMTVYVGFTSYTGPPD